MSGKFQLQSQYIYLNDHAHRVSRIQVLTYHSTKLVPKKEQTTPNSNIHFNCSAILSNEQ
ncbi:hypothetical protein PLUTE_a0535 [Pseudoalteromonas luteoviolacea DSM 6061]|nr:hypothetical protein [Pseudoalteromonas luteoviolacea DSM 6061]